MDLVVKEVETLRWEIVEGAYSEIISGMSLEEFRDLPADDPRRKDRQEAVVPGEVEVRGIDIPITSHAPMGMLFGAIKERIANTYKVSYSSLMLNRRKESSDPFRIQIIVDNSPVDALKAKVDDLIAQENALLQKQWKEAVKRGEQTKDDKPKTISSEERAKRYAAAKSLYNKACVEYYPVLLADFKKAVKAFAEDEDGLKWYKEYVTTTTDPFQEQDDKIKAMRDKVLVKADLMTVDRASEKSEQRESKMLARKRHKFEMSLVEALTNKDYIDDEVLEIAEQLGIPERDVPRIFEASRTNKPTVVYNMIVRVAAATLA